MLQTKSRDHDAREFYKARRQHRLISDDRISRDVQIEDTKKRIKELETKLADFASAYEVGSVKGHVVNKIIIKGESFAGENFFKFCCFVPISENFLRETLEA